MARLILFLLLFASAILAIMAVLAFLNPAGRSSAAGLPIKKEDTMPDTFRTVAYVLLLVLMVGVATGWLGQS